ncbi:MAG: hydrogenase maturation nickel metallochaperone HypA [Acidimicrobiales bacterium]|jgi:Zn finger protein HypA/HybF involved in hydrogenase expression
MHELSLVSELVEECCRRADGKPVSVVRVRMALPDHDGEMQQAFVMLTGGTPLNGAVLEIESAPLTVECACGYTGPVGEAGIAGHMFVCPECAQVGPIRDVGLELLEIVMSPLG